MNEHDDEPIRGLPGVPPAGEHILWQGAPDWRVLARTAFHVPLVALYFGVLILFGLAGGSVTGALATAGAGALGVGVLVLLAWATSRATVYTLTNRRVVLRIGIALPKCINLPLKLIGAADLRPLADGHGDIALAMTAPQRLGYALLWPHARPWRLREPQPMLRALPDAESVARAIARACADLVPIERASPMRHADPAPAGVRAVAA